MPPPAPSLPPSAIHFDRQTLGRFWRVSRLMFLSDARSFLFLDEASNALGDARRAVLYGELRRVGIRYLTTGPRAQLDRFHTRVLTLDGAGGWTVQDLPPMARAA